MKDLFRNRFPFVELPDSELTDEQLLIKKQYNEVYKLDVKSSWIEEAGNVSKYKFDQLREVRDDEAGHRGGLD